VKRSEHKQPRQPTHSRTARKAVSSEHQAWRRPLWEASDKPTVTAPLLRHKYQALRQTGVKVLILKNHFWQR